MNNIVIVIIATAFIAVKGTEESRQKFIAQGTSGVGTSDVNCLESSRCVRSAALTGGEEMERTPDSKEDINTEFRYYRPTEPSKRIVLTNKILAENIRPNSSFSPDFRMVFIIHGYQAGDAPWALELKDSIFKREKDCHVTLVDWGAGASSLFYSQAFENVPVVGREVADFIITLIKKAKLNPRKVHLIGHSLGAHVSGYAGQFLIKESKAYKVGRITGLDPAGPDFYKLGPKMMLSRDDALFVDVIHTDSADHLMGGFGLPDPIGHFDFYPNGGLDQPGCKELADAVGGYALGVLQMSNIWVIAGKWIATGKNPSEQWKDIQEANEIACSHGKAYKYLISSLENADNDKCKFWSLECSSWETYTEGKCGTCKEHDDEHHCVQMGYYAKDYKRLSRYYEGGQHLKKNVSMNFFLITSSRVPYCTS